MAITSVWAYNLWEELHHLEESLYNNSVIAVDSEFPGWVRNTARNACEVTRYSDLKFNVDATRIIQLGVSLCNEEGKIAGSWQFNFSFYVENEIFVDESLKFLVLTGMDFGELRKNGIDRQLFSNLFGRILARHPNLKWVSFHGLYDFAHMLKLITNKPMPRSVVDFTEVIADVFGSSVFDIKYIARFCDGLCRGELGLEKLAKIVGVERIGGAHQAGSDSLLTASVFAKMKTMYGIEESRYEGFLYSIGTRICKSVHPRLQMFHSHLRYCQPKIQRVLVHPPAFHYGISYNPFVLL